MIPAWKSDEPHEYYDPEGDTALSDSSLPGRVPALLTRLLTNHYTHKSYGRELLSNLAPGLDAAAIPEDLPSDVKDLLRWRNGYADEDDCVEMLPVRYRLLSLDEAVAFSRSVSLGENDKEWWNDDVYPVFVQPDLQTCIIVSKSTGRAAYRRNSSVLTDDRDMGWFPHLYALLRKVEVAAEERRIAFAKRSGRPMEGPYPGGPEEKVLILTDVEEGESDDEEEEAEGKE